MEKECWEAFDGSHSLLASQFNKSPKLKSIILASFCDGGDSCCVNGNCGVGEGDCDLDSDCKPGNRI